MKGKAIIFSAPSGAGKTTIVRELLQRIPSLKFSISATTRNKREYEVNGKDYYFLSVKDFIEKRNNHELLEWEEVYQNLFYGTLNEEIDRIWEQGNHVIFDVDVKGGINIKKALGDQAISIFINVKDSETLRERLSERNTESEESLNERVAKSTLEMKEMDKFDEVVFNEELDKAIHEAEILVNNFLKK